ncbi:cobyrinate a,c-diamide synthase [Jiella sp. MQZ9-1]|uniref:Hydrogenobyrinate a,c-diamide synthase n=1 Tax=Jiella flava TaxID=2816857 RepID=A0A939FYA1_9HYPH|nr:cobyrinate a,c-diamide synthase [Jiella flava]MBO0661757.1 cobyrinate a,c-diamide synthase [Jiella flava]MCD2470398.1 cobyrinate a,c-diamide synthase [Jiella flava]
MAGLMIAAPSSGAGKTTATLALIAALRVAGHRVTSAKAGPDYIDPAFHAAASGAVCVNLDPFAMRPGLIAALADRQGAAADCFVIEAMMGLFDGAADGRGSAADLAAMLDAKIVLVVDCARQSHSVAALVAGFHNFRAGTRLAGLILNRVGSPRHLEMLTEALRPLGLPVLAALPRREDLKLSDRHLGLVQAGEHADLAGFLKRAGSWMTENADLDQLALLARPAAGRDRPAMPPLPPLGQTIAIARDAAFAFAYPHLLAGWRTAGAALSFFSPLADEAPARDCDALFLPGGYPELHAGRLAAADRFRAGCHAAAARGALVYGECGGYMALGDGLIDAEGARHPMLGLLPLETSFAERRRHLGYRRLTPLGGTPFKGELMGEEELMGHEFHYATTIREKAGAPRLFAARDALGADLGAVGLRHGRVMGSFCHVIDRQ